MPPPPNVLGRPDQDPDRNPRILPPSSQARPQGKRGRFPSMETLYPQGINYFEGLELQSSTVVTVVEAGAI